MPSGLKNGRRWGAGLYFWGMLRITGLLAALCFLSSGHPRPDDFLEGLLEKYPAWFAPELQYPDSLGVQIIYTRVDRTQDNRPVLTDYTFNVHPDRYFYPASTVKLPVAVLALQRLHELKVPGVDLWTTLLTDSAYEGESQVLNDPTSSDGRPSVGQYVKRIFLTSDNEAFNRLYEWLGPAYINRELYQRGYSDAQIRHRLEVTLREDQNRRTNPSRFLDEQDRTLWVEGPQLDDTRYAPRADTVDGVNFSRKNRISLTDLHRILRSVIFPESVPESQRFDLSADEYRFLYRCMSELPGETNNPALDTADFPDSYVKFLLWGGDRTPEPRHIRIFNKIGQAYGYLIDVAYVVDLDKGIEFFLSAMIRCNPDRQLGDENYTYDSLGFPFLHHLGQVIYQYELERPREYRPDLSRMRFVYDK